MTERELPFAGHPTIGTAVYALGTLAGNAKRGRMLCNAGPVEVEFDGVKARCAIPHNFHRHQSTACSETEVLELQPLLNHGHHLLETLVIEQLLLVLFVLVFGLVPEFSEAVVKGNHAVELQQSYCVRNL